MYTKIFPFQIGEQYEELEFKLNGFDIKLIGDYEYDIYEYIGQEVNSFLGFQFSLYPLLYYNVDILSRIDFMFSYNCFDDLFNELNYYLPEKEKLQIDPFDRFKTAFSKVGDLAFEILRNNSENIILRISHYHQFFD